MKVPDTSGSAISGQIQLVRESIAAFDAQIAMTDEMMTGLALLRAGLEMWQDHFGIRADAVLGSPVLQSHQLMCQGAIALVTNWGRRLQLDKAQLGANKRYNQNLLRAADSGILIP